MTCSPDGYSFLPGFGGVVEGPGFGGVVGGPGFGGVVGGPGFGGAVGGPGFGGVVGGPGFGGAVGGASHFLAMADNSLSSFKTSFLFFLNLLFLTNCVILFIFFSIRPPIPFSSPPSLTKGRNDFLRNTTKNKNENYGFSLLTHVSDRMSLENKNVSSRFLNFPIPHRPTHWKIFAYCKTCL